MKTQLTPLQAKALERLRRGETLAVTRTPTEPGDVATATAYSLARLGLARVDRGGEQVRLVPA